MPVVDTVSLSLSLCQWAELQVRIYDLADGHDFRCLHQLDVGRLLRRVREPLTQSAAGERRGLYMYG